MRRIAQISLASIASIALVAGCANREIARVDPNQTKEQFKDIPVEVNRDIDILFVIDNSGSMEAEQTSLAANFYRFIEVLQNIEGGLPNVHIGVISTDLGAGNFNINNCQANGDNGTLQSQPRGDCTGPDGAFIRDVADANGNRITNYDGNLADTFACIAQLGTEGCGFEQQLESMRRALNGSNPVNSGFLRENAFLAVIFVTDEDDCSTENNAMFDTSQNTLDSPLGPLSSFRCFEFGVYCEPDTARVQGPRQNCRPRTAADPNSSYMYKAQEYVDFLKGLKADPTSVIVAGIIGNATPVSVRSDASGNPDLTPSCESSSGEAAPGVRLKYFLDQFPLRNTVESICNENLEGALVVIANLLAEVIGNPCLDGEIADMDPLTEGIQPECQVSDVRYPGTDYQEETRIPHCDLAGGAYPCWHVEDNPVTCDDTPTHLELIVERNNAEVPQGTHVQVRCVVN
jgi:hypothetical protein